MFTHTASQCAAGHQDQNPNLAAPALQQVPGPSQQPDMGHAPAQDHLPGGAPLLGTSTKSKQRAVPEELATNGLSFHSLRPTI